MDPELSTKLYDVALETFGHFGAMTPLPPDSPACVLSDYQEALVDFQGPVTGTFCMRFYGDLPRALAETAFPGEPAMGADPEDVLKEIANIVCGNILPYIAGPTPVFKMDPPRMAPGATRVAEPKAAVAQAIVAFQEGQAQLEVFVSP